MRARENARARTPDKADREWCDRKYFLPVDGAAEAIDRRLVAAPQFYFAPQIGPASLEARRDRRPRKALHEEFVTGHRDNGSADLERILATVMFTDIVDSTRQAAQLGDQQWRSRLDQHDALARQTISRHRGILVKSTGDGVLATFDGPGRAIRCALSFSSAAHQMGLPVRAGLHTGEIELRGTDIGGIAVHAAARVMARSEPDEVLVSRVVTDLVAGAGLRFSERGSHELKGLPGKWDLFAASA
jgi:class 3 adenylate cyclase